MDYLAKAREICPKKRRTMCQSVNLQHDDDIYNQGVGDCFPIVVEQLKRVDELALSDAHRAMELFCANKKLIAKDSEIARLRKALEEIDKLHPERKDWYDYAIQMWNIAHSALKGE